MANHFDRHYCGKCGLTYVYQKAGGQMIIGELQNADSVNVLLKILNVWNLLQNVGFESCCDGKISYLGLGGLDFRFGASDGAGIVGDICFELLNVGFESCCDSKISYLGFGGLEGLVDLKELSIIYID
ncbi:ubiquitin-40s ribosomal protein s27a [Quercus suber]|uniref:Ubiquitin-40s ribosomal protein s27a n=1 Tax=Quercus suber TaxID=58331 RepID=A0AAW0LQD3_QUESU